MLSISTVNSPCDSCGATYFGDFGTAAEDAARARNIKIGLGVIVLGGFITGAWLMAKKKPAYLAGSGDIEVVKIGGATYICRYSADGKRDCKLL